MSPVQEDFLISISPFRRHGPASEKSSPRGIGVEDNRCAASTWLDGARDLRFFQNGRSALWACLKYIQLNSADDVCIETTSGGPYISSCVTRTIDSVCTWSRAVTPRTKLILVIHEFGFPCDELKMERLASRNIPILEDCAYAVGSRTEGAAVGRFGEFAVYSFSKHYAVPRGGILVSRDLFGHSELWNSPELRERALADSETSVLLAMLSADAVTQHSWNSTRQSHWMHFAERLTRLGVQPYFDLNDNVVPGVFVCKLPPGIQGLFLKQKFQNAGIEATEYYGHGGFYFPVHQSLTDAEMSLMLGLFENEDASKQRSNQ